ncbi:MAG: exo-alpha-sialidase, partial [Clostridia bacterium]|nr:exo-alpha-sialidase [Clostridia bacterium]
MLKNKIKNMQKTIGMHINLNDVAIAKIAGLAGYDFIWIDLEHSNLSLENLLADIIAIKSCGTSVIVRVPADDLTYTKKVIEMGVDGIIFPMVRTAKQAAALIDNTVYPPYGTRGFGPMNAVGYGFDDVSKYISHENDSLCRFIQIEHIDAVNNLEEIVQNEYIDGYIFGPNDLSGSIGQLGKVFDTDTTKLINKSIEILRKHNKYIGLSTGDISEKTLSYWHSFDIDMLSAGADFGFLQQTALNNRRTLERIHKPESIHLNKTYYTKDNLTEDINCSLKAPSILDKSVYDSECYSPKYRKWQSAPSICITSDKTLYCAFSGDNFGGDEQPNNYNVILKSCDGGESWSPFTVIDHYDSVRLHEPILWTDEKGTLWHFWAQSYNWWDGRGGVWAIKLVDGKWSEPKRLCDGVLATPPVTLSDGSIMLPVSIWKNWRNTLHSYPNYGNAGVYISRNGGESFEYVGGADAPDSIFDENAIVQRNDGSLFMIIRCKKRIAFSVSYDLGKSWSEPETLM